MSAGVQTLLDVAFEPGIEVFGYRVPLFVIAAVAILVAILVVVLIVRMSRKGKNTGASESGTPAPKHMKR